MYHKIETVKVLPDCFIETHFLGGSVKRYDVKKLFIEFPQFKQLENNMPLFCDVQVDVGGYGISWNDELDLDADTIWEDGILIEHIPEHNISHLLAYQLLMARKQANITQKQLADITGIYQADISKIERGLGNPSLQTLNRLAEGLGMQLKIQFESST